MVEKIHSGEESLKILEKYRINDSRWCIVCNLLSLTPFVLVYIEDGRLRILEN